MDREEVDRSELGHMIGEERSPRLGWRLGMADHVFGNGRLRNRYAQFQEFAVKCVQQRLVCSAGVSPAGVNVGAP